MVRGNHWIVNVGWGYRMDSFMGILRFFSCLYASVFQQGTAIKLSTCINRRKKAFVYGKVIFYKMVYSGAKSIRSGKTSVVFSQKGSFCIGVFNKRFVCEGVLFMVILNTD